MQGFSIIIPTLNEAGNIEPLLNRLEQVMRQHCLNPELLFIDDGSVDGTRQYIETYRGILDVRLIRRDTERGLTGAVVAGAKAARNDLVVVMDADLSHPPEKIPELMAPLAEGRCDIIIGSRYTAGGEMVGWPRYRKAASSLASLPARLLTGARDPLAGFFAVHKKHITSVTRDLSGFKIGLEILAGSRQPLRVLEVPIRFEDRWSGSSKMSVSVLGKYLRQVLRLTMAKKPSWATTSLLLVLLAFSCYEVLLASLITDLGYPQLTARLVSLLITAHIYYIIMPITAKSGSSSYDRPGYALFCTVLLLGLFLRDGILALPLFQAGAPAIAMQYIGTLCCLGTATILSHSRLQSLPDRQTNWQWFGTGLILYTIMIRLVYLGNIELLQEEAYYWNYAQHMATGYLDHPPMVALLIRGGTLLFGNSELGVRFFTFLCWFITAFFSFRLTAVMFDKNTAFRAVILVAVLPIFFCTGLLSTPDAPLIASWAGALYFLYLALVRNRENGWYGAGICLGLGLASKYTMALLAPAIILFMLTDSSARRYFFCPQPYLAALIALAMFSPVIWWNFQNDWASFLFQSQERLQASSEFSTHELLASILLLITPTGFLATLLVCGKQPSPNIPGNRQHIFGLTMLLVPLSIFVLVSITKEVKLNWTGPIWLSAIPFIAWTMFSHPSKLGRAAAVMWPKTLLTLALLYGALLHYSALGLPGVPYSDIAFLFGWDDLARQVDNQVQELAARQGSKPLVAGMDHYQIASGLAFYRKKHAAETAGWQAVDETTGRQLFGRDALMYEYWHPPTMANNRDILVVAHKKSMLAENAFKNKYDRIGDIKELIVEKQGQPAGRYYYRVLSGYSWEGKPTDSRLTLSDTKPSVIPNT